jgi:hypothetical protein
VARLSAAQCALVIALGLAAAHSPPKVTNVQLSLERRRRGSPIRFSIAQIKVILLGVGFNNGTGLKRGREASFDPTDPASQSHSGRRNLLSRSPPTSESPAPSASSPSSRSSCGQPGASRGRAIRRRRFHDAVLIVFAGVATVTMGDPFHEDAVLALTWMYSGIILGFYDAEFGSRSRSSTLA